MGIPDHLTCLLRNWYAGQEATVRTGHGTTDWFQIGKGVRQGCILSPCLFNLYAEYIIRNIGLEETQAGIKIARRNINKLRYADDTTLMAESEEELKSLLMKVKEVSTSHMMWRFSCYMGIGIYHLVYSFRWADMEFKHLWGNRVGREFQKITYFCFIDYAKAFDCVDHNKLGEFWKRWEYQATWPASWEACM